ncbi:hypothetical protein SELMODRAFT_411379 [Selaginella moellendorffii]|uniref:RNA-polymerase II-associated protein 3-like C-terminal domain-containing protein n=1 Tax=Selaginella moellendorffii TaxID=88036 RepID=D8RHG1_SELML|nr:hypothetical protein SELMODRAFT_411379 [Selaginella moellendorffii]
MDAQKQIRENTQELHDFLRGLQDWEKEVKNKDNELKTKSQDQVKELRPVREKKRAQAQAAPSVNAAKHTYDYFRDKWDKFDVDAALREVDEENEQEKVASKSKENDYAAKGTPQTFSNEAVQPDFEKGSLPDAVTEKELGNELFKEKKYVQAIECYSRSIGLHPTAVAYANRAMALLKIRRYEDAEMDCSEAIALDDRYTKAYARRGTARRERDKLLGAVEDFEFALRLEPHNKDLQKQYEEAKALYEKKNAYRPPEDKVTLQVQRSSIKAVNGAESMKKTSSQTSNGKQPVKDEAAMQASTIRAAATAMNAVTQHMVAPKTSYEFETLWRGFGDDVGTKARLLKAGVLQVQLMDPNSLPKVFRDALSATLMVDIIRTLDTMVNEDTVLVAQVLDNLTKVGRFSMTIMCLSHNDKSVIQKLWEKLPAPVEDLEKWEALRKKYRV